MNESKLPSCLSAGLISLAITGCGASAGDESTSAVSSALHVSSTHLYLRCNATGWALTDANHLQPSADGRLAILDFQVNESWMVQNGDTCIITETDILNGWTSQTTSWTTGNLLQAPTTKRLSESWTTFTVRYPTTGTFRAVVDRTIGIVTIAPPGTWVHPFAGEYPRQWVPGGYIDHDPGPGGLDYAGGNRVLDGHTGVDYGVGSFRAMDNGLEIVAAAPGMVVFAEDQHFDRVTQPDDNCGSEMNVVIVEGADGTRYDYGHLKQNSVLVNEGQVVSAGQPLGVVGSSGCSSGPHLHFEARTPNDVVIDPFQQGKWAEPLSYVAPVTVMEVAIVADGVQNDQQVIDPGPNATILAPEQGIGLVAHVAGGDLGDSFTMRLVNPSGDITDSATVPFTEPLGQTVWVFNFGLTSEIGSWRAEFLANDVIDHTELFQVAE